MKSIYEIRRDNLQRLIDDRYSGVLRRMATDVSMADTSLHRVIKRHRNMGDSLARKIEEHLNLDDYWMDNAHPPTREAIDVAELRTVPLLDPDEIEAYLDGSLTKIRKPQIAFFALGARAYALRVPDKAMEVDGVGYIKGSALILDPDTDIENDSISGFMLDGAVIVRYTAIAKDSLELTALNQKHPPISSTIHEARYLGRVVEVPARAEEPP